MRRLFNLMWKIGMVLNSTSSIMSSSTSHSSMAGKRVLDWESDQFQFSNSVTPYLGQPLCSSGTVCRFRVGRPHGGT